jgi:glycosyltransferase involved in cell wall biosynthesis
MKSPLHEGALPQVACILVIGGFAPSLVNFRGPLLQALVARGLQVHAAAPGLLADDATRAWLEAQGITPHDIPLARAGMNPMQDLRSLLALWGLMRRVRPDAVLGYTIKPVIYGTLAAWLAGVPHRFALITGLGYAFTGAPAGRRAWVQKVARRLYALALARAEKVFFQNPDDAAWARQVGVVPQHVPTVVLNGSGVDLAQFAVAPLPAGAPRFLLIARLLGDKGIREYAQAAAQLKQQYPYAQFALAGDLDANPDAVRRAEVEQWVRDGVLEYLGFLPDVRPAVAQCSVYVLPSYYREGTPRTVLEAMAMGRAIITTDAPGCRETVVEGENGFLVPIRSVDALVQAMRKFLQDPALAARMGQRSRQIAEQKYDVHKVNAVMLHEMGLG